MYSTRSRRLDMFLGWSTRLRAYSEKSFCSLRFEKKGRTSWSTTSSYLKGDLLFWGARNIDGRGFDAEQNRPTNLQIPLIRK